MPFDLDTLHCNHAGSRGQTGEPAGKAGVPHEGSTVGTKLGNTTGKFYFLLLKLMRHTLHVAHIAVLRVVGLS